MNYLKRYGIGDYFNNIITLVPKMLKSCLLPAIIVFLPAGLFYFLGFQAFGTSIAQLEELLGDPEDLLFPILKILSGFLWFIPAGIFTAGGHCLLTAMVGKKTFSIIHGEEAPGQPVQAAFKNSFWPLVVQGIIIGALVGAFMLIIVGIIVALLLLVIRPGADGDSPGTAVMVLTILTMVIMYLAMIPALYWFFVKTIVAPQAVIRENCGPFQGIKRSFFLTKGNFWRSLGIYLLIGMVISFAISMVSGPVIFIMILPGYIDFIKAILSSGDDYSSAQVFTMFQTLAPGIGIAMFMQSVFYYLIYPVFGSLMYTDLAIRKGEIAEAVPAPAIAGNEGTGLGQP